MVEGGVVTGKPEVPCTLTSAPTRSHTHTHTHTHTPTGMHTQHVHPHHRSISHSQALVTLLLTGWS